MLHANSSPRAEGASPPHQDVAMRKSSYTPRLAVDILGPQLHVVPKQLHSLSKVGEKQSSF
jgi:hypothetical protein